MNINLGDVQSDAAGDAFNPDQRKHRIFRASPACVHFRALAYCVSKGVDQLTCARIGAPGVRVNAVNPGVVVTEIHKRGGMRKLRLEPRTLTPSGESAMPRKLPNWFSI